jgi:chromosome segregation ATPase
VVDAVGLLPMQEYAPAGGLLGGFARGRVEVMARRPLELPPEARALIEQVRSLEARAERVRDELERDLDGIRQAAREERTTAEKELAARRKEADAELAAVTAEVAAQRERLAEDRAALEALLENRVRGFEFIASAWADYELARAEDDAFELERKSHPAYSAAERVRPRASSSLRRAANSNGRNGCSRCTSSTSPG